MKEPILIRADEVKIGMKVPAWRWGKMIALTVVSIDQFGENKLLICMSNSENGRITSEFPCNWHSFSIIPED